MSRSAGDRLLLWALRGCAAVAGAVVLLIAAFLVIESLPALRRAGPAAFLSGGWHPKEGRFDLTPMLAGTVLATAGAVLLAGPLGVLSAVFCRFYAPPAVAAWYRRLIELLAGIPSVVYGLWGLVNVVPLVGASLLAGVFILALMILPTVALTADAALAAVPRAYLQSAAALGLSRWATVRAVVLPAAWPGILAGALLATGRALGETMAVLMVTGNVVRVPDGIFAPVRTLTANIALEMAYAMGDHRSALFVAGLLLLALVAALVVAAEALGEGRGHG